MDKGRGGAAHHLAELLVGVEDRQLYLCRRSESEMRGLLTRVGVDDALRLYAKLENLAEAGRNQQP